MTNLKQLKNDVIQYSEEAILDGNFKFICCDECTAKLSIDGEDVYVWITSDHGKHFTIYDNGKSLKVLFVNEEICLKGWSKVKPFVEDYRKKILIAEAERNLKRLKGDL